MKKHNVYSDLIKKKEVIAINWLIVLSALSVATVTDVKTRTIPLWLFPLASICSVATRLALGQMLWLDSVIAAVLMFAVYLFAAVFFEGGGGDAIMMGLTAFCIGLNASFYAAMIASALYVVAVILAAKNNLATVSKKTIPFAPFALVGLIGTLVIKLL